MTRRWKPRNKAEREAADRAVSFIRGLTHTKGVWARRPFDLRAWQEHEIIRPLFGTLRADGKRQYRTAYVEVPRKNGKSELAAAVALYLLFRDGEHGAEIYGAASDRDQASLVFDVAAQMVRQSPVLMENCQIKDSVKRIVRHERGSFYRAIPADAAGSHGFNASGIIFDELHTQPNRDLWDVLTTSTGAREQPLTFAITTAGYDRESICYEQHDYAHKILTGAVDDSSFFAYIRSAPEEADWRDEKVWKRCNPALGDFRGIDEMRDMASRAEQMPALQNTFRRLYLNQWTQQQERWIDINLWDSQAGPTLTDADLAGKKCYGGLDLATVQDMTAWVLAFPEDSHVNVRAKFFCPESRLRDTTNRYRAQYQQWANDGWLTVTKGEATDYAFVKATILEDVGKFQLVDLNVDRLFQAHQLAQELGNEIGEDRVIGMGQGFTSMAAPMKEFERRLLDRRIRHGGNPILRWMADNVAVKQDPAGNLKADKATSQGKIDGIVALVMALDRLMQHEDPPAWISLGAGTDDTRSPEFKGIKGAQF